jgi:hypothetical protein
MKRRGSIPVAVLAALALVGGSLGCSPVDRLLEGARRLTGDDSSAPIGADEGPTASVGAVGEQSPNGPHRAPPQLMPADRLVLAYPMVTARGMAPIDMSRAINGDVFEWPEMRFLEEYELIGGVGYEPVSVRPTEIRIVRGSSIPMSYSPELDISKPEPNGSPAWYRGLLDKPVLFIPPNASLVMVRIETNPSPGLWAGPGAYQCPDDGTRWGYRTSEFRLGYPGLGETQVNLTGDSYWFGENQAPSDQCPGNGWLYFIVAGLDVDPSLLWLEYIAGTDVGQLAFWTLTERP